MAKPRDDETARKISNGPNDRPRDAPIGETGPGLPDDSSRPEDPTPEEEAAIARKIREI